MFLEFHAAHEVFLPTPANLQLVGPMGAEELLLAIANVVEAAAS